MSIVGNEGGVLIICKVVIHEGINNSSPSNSQPINNNMLQQLPNYSPHYKLEALIKGFLGKCLQT